MLLVDRDNDNPIAYRDSSKTLIDVLTICRSSSSGSSSGLIGDLTRERKKPTLEPAGQEGVSLIYDAGGVIDYTVCGY